MDMGTGSHWFQGLLGPAPLPRTERTPGLGPCLQARPCRPRKPSQTGQAISLPFKDRLCLPRALGATRQLHSSPLPWDPCWARSEGWSSQQPVPRPGGQGWAWAELALLGVVLFVSCHQIPRRSVPFPCLCARPRGQIFGTAFWTCPAVTGQKRGWWLACCDLTAEPTGPASPGVGTSFVKTNFI